MLPERPPTPREQQGEQGRGYGGGLRKAARGRVGRLRQAGGAEERAVLRRNQIAQIVQLARFERRVDGAFRRTRQAKASRRACRHQHNESNAALARAPDRSRDTGPGQESRRRPRSRP